MTCGNQPDLARIDHRLAVGGIRGIGQGVSGAESLVTRVLKGESDGIPAPALEQSQVTLTEKDEASVLVGVRAGPLRQVLAALWNIRGTEFLVCGNPPDLNVLNRLMRQTIQDPSRHTRGNVLRGRVGFAAGQAKEKEQ